MPAEIFDSGDNQGRKKDVHRQVDKVVKDHLLAAFTRAFICECENCWKEAEKFGLWFRESFDKRGEND